MLKLWYYLRNFFKNRIEILFHKFLSGFQPYKKYRDKTFPLKDSEVLSKKNKGSPPAAFCMKITANIWKKQLPKPIERLSICNRIFCKWLLSINFLLKEFLQEPSTTLCDQLFAFYNWSKLVTHFCWDVLFLLINLLFRPICCWQSIKSTQFLRLKSKTQLLVLVQFASIEKGLDIYYKKTR